MCGYHRHHTTVLQFEISIGGKCPGKLSTAGALSVGAALSVAGGGGGAGFRDALSAHAPHGIALLGPRVWDLGDLNTYVVRHGASPTSVRGVAELLARRGTIVGMVRGRTEVGPRALGQSADLFWQQPFGACRRQTPRATDRIGGRVFRHLQIGTAFLAVAVGMLQDT